MTDQGSVSDIKAGDVHQPETGVLLLHQGHSDNFLEAGDGMRKVVGYRTKGAGSRTIKHQVTWSVRRWFVYMVIPIIHCILIIDIYKYT